MRLLSMLVASVKMNGNRQSSRHQVVMELGKFVPMKTTPQNVEVIVVGAGIAGLAAARDLSIDGYDVLGSKRATGSEVAFGPRTIWVCQPTWEPPGSTASKTTRSRGWRNGTESKFCAPISRVFLPPVIGLSPSTKRTAAASADRKRSRCPK